MEQPIQRNTGILRRLSSNVLVYVITLVAVAIFVYFIYKFIYGSSSFQSNLVMGDKVTANDPDEKTYKKNVKLPNIYEGNEFSVNFWIYIADYKYRNGQRKHIVEIGHDTTHINDTNFSTLLVALGATKPSLQVRVHTVPSDHTIEGSHNYGITDCSGGDPSDCSGGKMNGFQEITDPNLVSNSNMKDNSLFIKDTRNFFKAFSVVDENNLIDSSNTCDIKELPLQKWINVCIVMSGKTLDIYLDGKLVKTCIYKNYFRVDQAGGGPVLSYLQGGAPHGFDGQFSRLQVYNTALTPDDIYKNYLAGPTGSSVTNDPASFIKYLFTG